MNRRLVQLCSDINSEHIKHTIGQKKQEKREKLQKDSKPGKKKKKADDTKPDAPQVMSSKFSDKEREVHEAYQTLLGEFFKRKQQRRKQARMDAIREKELAEIRPPKSPTKSPGASRKEMSEFQKSPGSTRREFGEFQRSPGASRKEIAEFLEVT